PSSPTVTSARSCRVTRGGADSAANSPCPPPRAATFGLSGRTDGTVTRPPPSLAPQITVPHLHGGSPARQLAGAVLGARDAAVLAAGAADGQRDEALALPLVAGQH